MKKPLLFPSSNIENTALYGWFSNLSILAKTTFAYANNSFNGISFLQKRFFHLALFILMLMGGFQQVNAQTCYNVNSISSGVCYSKTTLTCTSPANTTKLVPLGEFFEPGYTDNGSTSSGNGGVFPAPASGYTPRTGNPSIINDDNGSGSNNIMLEAGESVKFDFVGKAGVSYTIGGIFRTVNGGTTNIKFSIFDASGVEVLGTALTSSSSLNGGGAGWTRPSSNVTLPACGNYTYVIANNGGSNTRIGQLVLTVASGGGTSSTLVTNYKMQTDGTFTSAGNPTFANQAAIETAGYVKVSCGLGNITNGIYKLNGTAWTDPSGIAVTLSDVITALNYALANNLITATPCPIDSDSDGIIDSIDIDDDNDGILDSVETGCTPPNKSTMTATTTLSVSGAVANLLDGTESNNFYYTNQTVSNSTIAEFTFPTATVATKIEITTDILNSFLANGLIYKVQGWNGSAYVDLTSVLTSNGSTTTTSTGGATHSEVFDLSTNTTAYTKYKILGISGSISNAPYVREAYFTISCLSEADTDVDGIVNRLDLDSDGDGCSDAFEGGATKSLTANYAFTGVFGTNGLANSLETVADNGIVNYTATYVNAISASLKTCTDSDGDGVADTIDLDDDNDGILDIVENKCNNPYSATTFPATTGVGSIDWQNIGTTLTATGGTFQNNLLGTVSITGTSGSQIVIGTGNNSGTYLEFANQAHTLTFSWTNPVTSMILPLADMDFDEEVTLTAIGATFTPILLGPTDAWTAPNKLSGSGNDLNSDPNDYSNIQVNAPAGITSLTLTFKNIGISGQNALLDFDIVSMLTPCVADVDGDGIENQLDLDSDGDGCPDAIEGGANLAASTLVTSTLAGGNTGGTYTGTSTSPVVKNLGNTVGSTATTLGIPTVATTGQTVGNSQNKLVQSANCPATCVAGTTAPIITATTVTNTCPATTFSLAGLANTGTKPTGTTLIWSTHKVPTSASDTLTNLTTVSTAGKYYALYFDKVSSCYSPADSVTATITVCCSSGTTAPTLSATTKLNVCPAITADISALVSSTCPVGSTLEWHNVATGLSAANKVANPATVLAGTYYPVCFDATNTCYSSAPATGVTVTINACLSITQPATQTGLPNIPKSGTVPTDVTPTGGVGTITYTNGSADPACVQPVGTTALPPSSNLTIGATGAYSYTTPAIPGTYYFCVKVCDSTTPTADCKIAIYKVTVSAPAVCAAGSAVPSLK